MKALLVMLLTGIFAALVVLLVPQETLRIWESDTLQVKSLVTSRVSLERKDLVTYEEFDGVLEYGETVAVSTFGSGVLTSIATEGARLERGSVVYGFYRSVSDTEVLVADQQIASAEAAVLQAEVSLEKLKDGPAAAEISSAEAAVSQAEVSFEKLKDGPTAVEISSAEVTISTAEVALEKLQSGPTQAEITSADLAKSKALLDHEKLKAEPTESEIAAADASVSQAEASLVTTDGKVDTTWDAFRDKRTQYCDTVNQRGYEICPDKTEEKLTPMTALGVKNLRDRMYLDKAWLTVSTNLLIAQENYASAVGSLDSATKSLESAKKKRSALDIPPTALELAQSRKSYESAKEKRFALDYPPTALELAQAKKSLQSAKEKRSALDLPPTTLELAQAQSSLDSATQKRMALDIPPTALELQQSLKNLSSAQASLKSALQKKQDLKEGPSGAILLYGSKPSWREFKLGMSDGIDVLQLKENLLVLGYGTLNELELDDKFTQGVEDSIARMQKDYGFQETGRFAFGEVLFVPGPSFIEASQTFPSVGVAISQNSTLVFLTPMQEVETKIADDGGFSEVIASLQGVSTQIDVSDQELLSVGSEVEIELPDEQTIMGTVSLVGEVAVIPQDGQGNPYLEVEIDLLEGIDYRRWTGAQVNISATKSVASNVLAAPVTSLLALLGGGYALEVVDSGTSRLVAVEIGTYADNWVEVRGAGLDENTEVIIPK